MANEYLHQPVLIAEVIEQLAIKPDGKYIDATFGRGGHSSAILKQLEKHGSLLAIDKDPQAIQSVPDDLRKDPRFAIEQGSFTSLFEFAKNRDWLNKVDGILLDLGVSSPQLDDEARGFSFLKTGPLDMRMDPTKGTSAATWLNHADMAEIADVIFHYGEERFARRIARAIVQERNHNPFTTTEQLANVIASAVPFKEKFKHPATRSFQAIRIFINNELEELQICLSQCLQVLALGGKLLVISFHSLEDRIVKRFMRDEAKEKSLPKDIPVLQTNFKPRLKIVSKPIRPSIAEIDSNPRARSAILRIAEKIS